MRFDLAQMAARKRNSRHPIVFRPIISTAAQSADLNSIYRRMLEPLTRAAEIMGDAYGRELARVLHTDVQSITVGANDARGSQISGNFGVTSITDAADDLGANADAIAQAINRLILELTPDLRRWALRVEQWHRGKWVRAVLSGAAVDLETIIGAEDVRETIDAFLVRNASLIRDVNSQARSKIADAVLRGYQQRAPIADVVKDIRAATDFARARARRIASHQTVSLASQLDQERQRQAGIEIVKYRHSGKKHPREEHKVRDGRMYELATWREVRFVNGKKVYGADTIEPNDRPGGPPGCGCTTQAVLTFEGELV